MKKAILFLLFTSAIYSQNSRIVANKVSDLQQKNTSFQNISPFTINRDLQNLEYTKTTDDATIATLNLEKVNEIVSQKNDFLELEIPYQDQNIILLLYKVDIQSQDFQLSTDRNINVAVEKGVHYRGIIKNDNNSLVSFNFFRNQINGIISGIGFNNIVIGRLTAESNTNNYIIYSDAKMKISPSFNCLTKDVNKTPSQIPLSGKQILSDKCATVYFEIDYDLFVANGSNVNQTNVWMNSVFNNVQTLYANDGINVALKSVFVWTTTDPYIGKSSDENLILFNQNRPVFNGDIGQLVGIDGGFGGIAITIGGLCSSYNFSYSDVLFSYNTVPVYSWSTEVITHELGHLLGSPHTHGCYWNGNDTAIDGCGPTAKAEYSEGSCPIGPIPSSQIGGTIMSYCHLLNGVGINFANGFGSQPKAKIIQAVNSSSCLSYDCINTCISQVTNLKIVNVTDSSVVVSWEDLDVSNKIWETLVIESPDKNLINWTETSTKNLEMAKLSPNTYYTVYVRPKCSNGLAAASRKIIFATSDNFCAGKPFTDAGGIDHPYDNEENWIRTVAPISNSDKIKVVFNSIDLEDGYDFLYIYNGTNTSSELLTPSVITGKTVVGPFESTDSSGALTFKFSSDTFVTGDGWSGNFSCETLGVNENKFIDFSYYPNPVKNTISIDSKNKISNLSIYSIEGKLLYSNHDSFFETAIDMSSFAVGTYIFKADFDEKPISFKVLRQ